MRSPLLRLAAGLLLLAACGKKKDGPTYNTGSKVVFPSPATGVLVATASTTVPLHAD